MDEDFSAMSDPDFLALRRRVREQLEHTPEHGANPELAARSRELDEEFMRRASLAWTQAANGLGEVTMRELATSHSDATRLLAVEVLLADPEAPGDDCLESCLYLLRDRLQGADDTE